MVSVKVRETYDLKTTQNKMTVIAIHTPNPDIIKKNFPGLLMQCKAYRPSKCDVRIACASVLPLDPLGVGTAEGDVAPEDVFNPILYKAMSNKGMSMLEERINQMTHADSSGYDVVGNSAMIDVDSVNLDSQDDFAIYYGLLADSHGWKHANPQSGLEMRSLRPLVYDVVATQGDMSVGSGSGPYVEQMGVDGHGVQVAMNTPFFLGKPKEMPFINCTSYSFKSTEGKAISGFTYAGFPIDPQNCEIDVPWVKIICGCIIIPPSRLHELFFRMVIEWEIDFSAIRTIGEITNFYGLSVLGGDTHFQNYDYSVSKKMITGDDESILDHSDACMVSANVDLKKVM